MPTNSFSTVLKGALKSAGHQVPQFQNLFEAILNSGRQSTKKCSVPVRSMHVKQAIKPCDFRLLDLCVDQSHQTLSVRWDFFHSGLMN